MNRALPGWAIDLIRDGAASSALSESGDRAVWSALVRTASSAKQRGWSDIEWESLILDDPRSQLGNQVRVKNGRKPRTAQQITSTVKDAWDRGCEWVSQQPAAWSSEESREQALERARVITSLIGDGSNGLTEVQRSVLNAAAQMSTTTGYLRLALSRRELMARTELGLTALRTALRHLGEIGLLRVVEPGRPAGPNGKRRANLYELADQEAVHHYLYRETRYVVPPAQLCGAPSNSSHGAPASYVVPPIVKESDPMKDELIKLTIETSDPVALAQAIQALAGNSGTHLASRPSTDLPDNVHPLTVSRRSA